MTENKNATKDQIEEYKLDLEMFVDSDFKTNGGKYLDQYSKTVTFESVETQTKFITQMEGKTEGADDTKDLETGGYVVIDLANAKATLIESTKKRSQFGVEYGDYHFAIDKPNIKFADEARTLLIIATWHTHPQGEGKIHYGPSSTEFPGAEGGTDTKSTQAFGQAGFVFDKNIYVVEKNGSIQKDSHTKGSYNVIESAWLLYKN